MIISKHYEFKDVNHNVIGEWFKLKARDVFVRYGFQKITVSWTDNFELRCCESYEMICEKNKTVFTDWGESLEVEAKDCNWISIGNKERFYTYGYYLEDGNKKYFDRKNEKTSIKALKEFDNVLICYYDNEKMRLTNFPICEGKFTNGESSLEFDSRNFISAKYLRKGEKHVVP